MDRIRYVAIVQANEQAVIASQVNAIGQFIGHRHEKIVNALIAGQKRPTSAVQNKQGPLIIDRIDKLLIGGQETLPFAI